MSGEAVAVIDDVERAQALLDPTRQRILQSLAEPDSAAGLAARLGLPRQRLNYHLHSLAKQGLVEVVRHKQRGSVSERVYRRTSDSWAISVDVLGALGARPELVQDRFSSGYQVAVASRAIAELAALRAGAAAAAQALPTLTIEVDVRFADAAARSAFAAELSDALAAIARKYHDELAASGRTFRLYLGAYPKPKGSPPSGPEVAGGSAAG